MPNIRSTSTGKPAIPIPRSIELLSPREWEVACLLGEGLKIDEIAVIVTTASGNSRAYRVAGPRVVDPHLAQDGSGVPIGDATGGTCVPLDPSDAGPLRLIIDAVTADPPAPAPDKEQKL